MNSNLSYLDFSIFNRFLFDNYHENDDVMNVLIYVTVKTKLFISKHVCCTTYFGTQFCMIAILLKK